MWVVVLEQGLADMSKTIATGRKSTQEVDLSGLVSSALISIRDVSLEKKSKKKIKTWIAEAECDQAEVRLPEAQFYGSSPLEEGST